MRPPAPQSPLQSESIADNDMTAATEVLVGVFGRAGWHEYYKREMVVDIGFVVFDAAQETTRVVGVRPPLPFHLFCSKLKRWGGTAVRQRGREQPRQAVLLLGRARLWGLRCQHQPP